MKTTDLFVELVVIGMGGLFTLSCLLYGLFPDLSSTWIVGSSTTSILPILAVTYFLGIIIDRLADKIFRNRDRSIRNTFFESNHQYHYFRNYAYTYASDKIIGLSEYGRSRLRITRAWVINCIFIEISSLFLIIQNTEELGLKRSITLLIITLMLAACAFWGSFLSWKRLVRNDYKRLKETVEFLRAEKQELSNDY